MPGYQGATWAVWERDLAQMSRGLRLGSATHRFTFGAVFALEARDARFTLQSKRKHSVPLNPRPSPPGMAPAHPGAMDRGAVVPGRGVVAHAGHGGP